jgi:hypothetical protein
MAADREVVRHDLDSDQKGFLSGGITLVDHHGHKSSAGGIRSVNSALSPADFGLNPYDNFNFADFKHEIENQELNEEIKKLLMENHM